MSKQPLLPDFKKIAERHRLKFIIEKPSGDPLLAIVNLEEKSLSIVSRHVFCKKHAITWAEDIINAGIPATEEEKKALQQASGCWKALLQTDHGFGVTNLQEIKQGDYVALYEGSFVDQKFIPFDPQFDYHSYIKTLSDESYLMSFTPTGAAWESGLITAKYSRGFGGFMQHLPNEDEVKSYYVSAEFKEKFSVENLLRVNLGNRVFFKAKINTPPLSQLGFSYISYWCGRTESPVLFNQCTGSSIPTSYYQNLRYFIKFVDTQSGEKEYQNYSIQQLQRLDRGGKYSTIGNLIYKATEHLKDIRDSKSGKIKPRSMYSRILIGDLTAHDFMTVANNYFIGNDPDDIQSPEHIKTVIYLYQRAEKLFFQKNNSTQATHCQKRIEFYKQHLQHLTAPGEQDMETKQLLEKYTLKNEKTSVDKNLAFRRAAAMGHLDDVTKLLFLGAQINDQGSGSQKTALHHAVIKSHFNILFFLISNQANTSIKDRDGKLAFDYVKAGSSLYQKIGESLRTNADIPPSLKLTFPFT